MLYYSILSLRLVLTGWLAGIYGHHLPGAIQEPFPRSCLRTRQQAERVLSADARGAGSAANSLSDSQPDAME